jgi:hypothetical protein
VVQGSSSAGLSSEIAAEPRGKSVEQDACASGDGLVEIPVALRRKDRL